MKDSTKDEIEGSVNGPKGAQKEGLGHLTNNPDLQMRASAVEKGIEK